MHGKGRRKDYITLEVGGWGKGRDRENNECGEERKCLEYARKERIKGFIKTL